MATIIFARIDIERNLEDYVVPRGQYWLAQDSMLFARGDGKTLWQDLPKRYYKDEPLTNLKSLTFDPDKPFEIKGNEDIIRIKTDISKDPVLEEGEMAYDSSVPTMYVGDNNKKVSELLTTLIASSTGVKVVERGVSSERPNPGVLGRLYIDTQLQAIFYDNGSSWTQITSGLFVEPDALEILDGALLIDGDAAEAPYHWQTQISLPESDCGDLDVDYVIEPDEVWDSDIVGVS